MPVLFQYSINGIPERQHWQLCIPFLQCKLQHLATVAFFFKVNFAVPSSSLSHCKSSPHAKILFFLFPPLSHCLWKLCFPRCTDADVTAEMSTVYRELRRHREKKMGGREISPCLFAKRLLMSWLSRWVASGFEQYSPHGAPNDSASG